MKLDRIEERDRRIGRIRTNLKNIITRAEIIIELEGLNDNVFMGLNKIFFKMQQEKKAKKNESI